MERLLLLQFKRASTSLVKHFCRNLHNLCRWQSSQSLLQPIVSCGFLAQHLLSIWMAGLHFINCPSDCISTFNGISHSSIFGFSEILTSIQSCRCVLSDYKTLLSKPSILEQIRDHDRACRGTSKQDKTARRFPLSGADHAKILLEGLKMISTACIAVWQVTTASIH